MEPDHGDRDPVQARVENRAGEAGGAVTVPARAAPVFVQAAEKRRRTRWEFHVLT
jgi:hypothetical protein